METGKLIECAQSHLKVKIPFAQESAIYASRNAATAAMSAGKCGFAAMNTETCTARR
jgi:hypothetical protein